MSGEVDPEELLRHPERFERPAPAPEPPDPNAVAPEPELSERERVDAAAVSVEAENGDAPTEEDVIAQYDRPEWREEPPE